MKVIKAIFENAILSIMAIAFLIVNDNEVNSYNEVKQLIKDMYF